MPGMSGFDLAEVLRANPRYSDVPIIALSSHSTPSVIERGRKAGFHNFVAKFDRQGLLTALKHVPQEVSKAAA
jgi:two-component system chemotaxis sensor kinase CheA